jgi:membrane-anchored protein YejM (alkaline phosphatase superfamily)
LEEFYVKYMKDIVQFSHSSNTPLYLFSWISTLAHYKGWINTFQHADPLYVNLLTHLESEGVLNNSVLIFMSDHGSRYGNYRLTLPGSYEDKLPNFWIRLPPWIKEKYPEWDQALAANSR